MVIESGPVVAWGENGEGNREGHKGSQGNFWVTDMFTIMILVTVPWVHIYVKTHQSAHFKYVQFTVYQLYLNRVFQKQSLNIMYTP